MYYRYSLIVLLVLSLQTISCSNIFAASSKGDPKSAAKDAILKNLKDPYSARFGSFTQINNELACYTVNARNSYGGYVGNREAFLSKIGGKWYVINFNEMGHNSCVNMQKRISANRRIEVAVQKAVLSHLHSKHEKFGQFTHEGNKYACITIDTSETTEDTEIGKEVFLKNGGKKWTVLSIDEIKHEACSEAIKYYPHKSTSEFTAIKAVLNNNESPSDVKFGEFTQINSDYACLAVNNSNGYEDEDSINHLAVIKKNGDGWKVILVVEKNGTCKDSVEKILAKEQKEQVQ